MIYKLPTGSDGMYTKKRGDMMIGKSRVKRQDTLETSTVVRATDSQLFDFLE